ILDIPTVQKYGQGVPETLAAFNHHFIVRGGRPQSLDGGEAPKGVVVIAFDSVEKAREWYESPAYQAIKPLRQALRRSACLSSKASRPSDGKIIAGPQVNSGRGPAGMGPELRF